MPADTSRPITPNTQIPHSTELKRIFALQKAAYSKEPNPTKADRQARLNALIAALEENEKRLIDAINSDFGGRSGTESLLADIVVSIAAVKDARRNLGKWMKKRSVPTPLHMLPASSALEPQPLGVIGIISPWNYPVQLAMSPTSAALAAGNRVMIKPSELTPATSEVMREMISKTFDEDQVAVITGAVEVGQAFAETPFDHLLFTGSTPVGRKVAMAAAQHLTPVTLELGGKSPAIIDQSADINRAALSIAHGKMYNAGQTCIAPDYVLAPRDKVSDVANAIATSARTLFPEIDTTEDYSAIISERHLARLNGLIDDARDAGAEIIEIGSSNALTPKGKLPLTLVINPPQEIPLMQEEIFGPVLPILGVGGREEAIEYVNRNDRPLALYWFGDDTAACDDVLSRTVSGGVTVNDTLWHVAQENLPFGGVGPSGIGAYHGAAGFETFSHMKPVFRQSRFASSKMLYPPYTDKTAKMIGLFRKLI